MIHSVSPGFTRERLVVAGFIRVRLGTFVYAKGSRASFGFAWAHSCASSGRRFHSGSLGFTLAHIDVVGFLRFCEGSLWRA